MTGQTLLLFWANLLFLTCCYGHTKSIYRLTTYLLHPYNKDFPKILCQTIAGVSHIYRCIFLMRQQHILGMFWVDIFVYQVIKYIWLFFLPISSLSLADNLLSKPKTDTKAKPRQNIDTKAILMIADPKANTVETILMHLILKLIQGSPQKYNI